MPKFTSPLDHVKVAAPCQANWETMVGSELVRFCSQCNLNVYNLSGMSKKEAEALLVDREGTPLCVRYYRRADGSILMKNCPVGIRALTRMVSRTAGALLSAILSFGAGVGIYHATWAEESEPEVIRPEVTMGSIAVRENPVRTKLPVFPADSGYETGQIAEVTRADQQHEMGRIVVPVGHPPKAAIGRKR